AASPWRRYRSGWFLVAWWNCRSPALEWPAMGFVRGFVAPFKGTAYVFRERLWHFVIVPVLLNVALAGGAAFMVGRYWKEELADRAVGSPALGTLLLVVTTGLGTIILFLILQPLVGA